MKRTTKKKGPIVRQLLNGDYVLMRGVSPIMIDQVMASVEDPPVPIAILENSGDEYPNPNDPEYVRKMALAQSTRERRSLHAICIFGLTLCDEDGNPTDPPDNGWELRLRMTGVDWKKEIEAVAGKLNEEDMKFARSSAYLMFAAVTAEDMADVMELAGVDEAEQRQAAATFRSQEE